MSNTGQATASQGFDTAPGGGGLEIEDGSLLSSAEAAVKRALAPADPGPGTGSRGEGGASGNRSASLGEDIWSSGGVARVVSLRPSTVPAPRMATFHALQQWEGYVVEVDIDKDEFVARLVDVTAGTPHETEEAEIPMAELSDRDAADMRVGSIFRWVIGYEHSPEGTRKRVSQIVFRDLPRMTESDWQAGREWARKMASALKP